MSTLTKHLLLIGRNPDSMAYIYILRHCIDGPQYPLGPFDGRVAAIIKEFVCTTPNQSRIFLPALQRRQVLLRQDFCYGPDDSTLWPQPWVAMYCHLAAIPRKPNDSNDALSLMWWDPTPEDFKSFDGSLVDGLAELSRPNFLLLQAMMISLESRLEDYKSPLQNPITSF